MQKFFIAASILYIAFIIYSGSRLFSLFSFLLSVLSPGSRRPVRQFLRKTLFRVTYTALCLFSLGFILFFRQNSLLILSRITAYWQLALLYFVIFLAAADILRLLARLLRKPLPAAFLPCGTLAALCLAAGVLVWGSFNARNIKTVRYDIETSKNTGGMDLRIALISDIHLGRVVQREWLAEMLNSAERLSPDIICIAGDFSDSGMAQIKDLESVRSDLLRLTASVPVYACLGNHDTDRLWFRENTATPGTYYRMQDEIYGIFPDTPPVSVATGKIARFLRGAGVMLLQDEAVRLGNDFYIAGRNDASPIGYRNMKRKSAGELLARCDKSKVIILLDHQPGEFKEAAAAGADLELCGHTHRGQVFPANIFTWFIYKLAGATHYGRFRDGAFHAVVSSGIGVWGFPLRTAGHAEIALITVHPK